jgi:hypothetical protein
MSGRRRQIFRATSVRRGEESAHGSGRRMIARVAKRAIMRH